MNTIYATGTVSVANGGTTVTGVGTSWQGKIFEGDLFTDPAQGLIARVTADATSNTSLSINAWPGTALSGDAYEILLTPDSVRSSERTRQLLEQLSVVQANGRGLFFLFSDTTADADPGAGYVRLNNADASLATALYIDLLDANGAGVSGEIDTWDDSSSLTKGRLWLRSIADPSAFRAYSVTGSVVDGTGYRKLTLVHVGGSGSFAADDEIMVAFARTGDAGEGYVTDATVADPSELTALESEDAGYLVFVTDMETDFGAYAGRSGVVRLIAGPDWEVVAVYTGPQGVQGETGDTGPVGPIGVDWQGAYSGGTAYVVNDGVLYNGSSWRALGATTGNAPPTLPTTSNTWWELIARQGTDGAGTIASITEGDSIAVDNTDPTAPVISLDASGWESVLAGGPIPSIIYMLVLGDSIPVGRTSGGRTSWHPKVKVWNNENDTNSSSVNLGTAFITPNIAAFPFDDNRNSVAMESASNLAECLEDLGHTFTEIRLVWVANGGAVIADWVDASNVKGAMYTRMDNVIDAMRTAVSYSGPFHIVGPWIGTNDNGSTGSWGVKADYTFAAMETDDFITSDTPIVMGQPTLTYPAILDVLQTYVTTSDRIELAYTASFPNDGGGHYSGPATDNCGWEFVRGLSRIPGTVFTGIMDIPDFTDAEILLRRDDQIEVVSPALIGLKRNKPSFEAVKLVQQAGVGSATLTDVVWATFIEPHESFDLATGEWTPDRGEVLMGVNILPDTLVTDTICNLHILKNGEQWKRYQLRPNGTSGSVGFPQKDFATGRDKYKIAVYFDNGGNIDPRPLETRFWGRSL